MPIVFDLPTIWALIITFAIFAYVVMDGFDLGIGILFPTLAEGKERDSAMNSIAPVWDGNETWLVLGGGGLMAAFPLAYGVVLSALYTPIIAMLLALIFRGVAFEFRWRDPGHRKYWDWAFTLGSVVAALAQGITLGGLLQGIAVEGRAYSGGWWDWLSPFSVLVGASLVCGYGLLGATWLIMKSEGGLQEHCQRLALRLGIGTIAAVAFFFALRHKRDYWPFLIALALFALGLAGLGVSMYPYVVPRAITIWDAAAPPASLEFMLVGAVVMVPIILAYTGYAYWIFRGKTGPEGYH
jgi:cytochrome d ubiquinol oxidase subunit II